MLAMTMPTWSRETDWSDRRSDRAPRPEISPGEMSLTDASAFAAAWPSSAWGEHRVGVVADALCALR
jgi:hypothetical protein